MSEEKRIRLFEGKYDDGFLTIEGKGHIWDVYLNGERVDDVYEINLNFSRKRIPMLTLKKRIVPDLNEGKGD